MTETKKQTKTRGKAIPREIKERAYQLVAVDGLSYREVASIVGINDASSVFAWVKAMEREKAIQNLSDPKIDKSTPVPPRKPTRYYLRLAFKLNEGESILFPTHSEGRRMYRALRDMGFYARSKQDGNKMRVWKIADLDK